MDTTALIPGAQTGSQEDAGHHLLCFGVGDGWPSFARNHSSFLYRLGSEELLIDCGESVSRSYRSMGLDWNGFNRILLSHFHADHIGGLFMLVQGCWLLKRTRPLKVHLPEDGIEPIQKMLWAACLFEEALPFELEFCPLKHGQTFEVGASRVTPYLTTHLERLKATYGDRVNHRFEAFSFLIEKGGRKYGHSADLGAPSDLDEMTQGRRLDHLLCELAHFSPESLVDYLGSKEMDRVTLTHLSNELWLKRESLGIEEPLNRINAELRIAEDGLKVSLCAD